MAFQAGYVMDLKTLPHVILEPQARPTATLQLVSATTRLAGALVDSDNAALAPVSFAQITVFSTDLFFAIGITDGDGKYSVPVTAGAWTIRPEWQSVISRSYLPPEAGSFFEASFDTSGGAVTGANVGLKNATALLHGHLRDNNSNNIPGIIVSASADGGAYSAYGMSDLNGE